jgi:hypothetical protein
VALAGGVLDQDDLAGADVAGLAVAGGDRDPTRQADHVLAVRRSGGRFTRSKSRPIRMIETSDRHGAGTLTRTVLPQANAHAMIRRRAAAAGIATKLDNHSFRATGITAYLKNGGTLEKAAAMANHASTPLRRSFMTVGAMR